jgi:hypothetical protein
MTSDVQTGIMQTALDIDDAILREVKALHEREGRSMGAVVSELLAEALCTTQVIVGGRRSFRWASLEMKALIDLADREAIAAALDGSTAIEKAGRTARPSRSNSGRFRTSCVTS